MAKQKQKTGIPVAHLYIGLGGSGYSILSWIRWLLERRNLSDQERELFHHFLLIDTVTQESQGAQDRPSVVFSSATERVLLGARPVVAFLANRDDFPNTKRRFPPERYSDAEIRALTKGQGAGKLRTMGSLLFALNYPEVVSHLERSIKNMKQAMNRVQQRKVIHEGESPILLRFWVFGSLAGGTGCGAFLELGLLLRALTAGGRGMNTTAMFVLPTAYLEEGGNREERARTLANGYAALKELEYARDLTLDSTNLPPIEFRYDGSTSPDTLVLDGNAKGVFDDVFLFDIGDASNRGLPSRRELFEMIARITVAQSTTPFGVSLYQKDVNSRKNDVKDNEGRPVVFWTAGSGTLQYPADRIIWYSTNRCLEDYLGAILGPQDDTQAGNDVRSFLQEYSLLERGTNDEILEGLLAKGWEETGRRDFSSRRDGLEARIKSVVQRLEKTHKTADFRRRFRAALEKELATKLEQAEKDVIDHGRELRESPWIDEWIRQRVADIVQRARGSGKKGGAGGLRQAIAFTTALAEEARRTHDELSKELATWEGTGDEPGEKERLRTRMKKADAELKKYEGLREKFSRRDNQLRAELVQSLRTYVRQEFLAVAKKEALRVLGEIERRAGRARDWLRRSLSTITSVLEEAHDACRAAERERFWDGRFPLGNPRVLSCIRDEVLPVLYEEWRERNPGLLGTVGGKLQEYFREQVDDPVAAASPWGIVRLAADPDEVSRRRMARLPEGGFSDLYRVLYEGLSNLFEYHRSRNVLQFIEDDRHHKKYLPRDPQDLYGLFSEATAMQLPLEEPKLGQTPSNMFGPRVLLCPFESSDGCNLPRDLRDTTFMKGSGGGETPTEDSRVASEIIGVLLRWGLRKEHIQGVVREWTKAYEDSVEHFRGRADFHVHPLFAGSKGLVSFVLGLAFGFIARRGNNYYFVLRRGRKEDQAAFRRQTGKDLPDDALVVTHAPATRPKSRTKAAKAIPDLRGWAEEWAKDPAGRLVGRVYFRYEKVAKIPAKMLLGKRRSSAREMFLSQQKMLNLVEQAVESILEEKGRAVVGEWLSEFLGDLERQLELSLDLKEELAEEVEVLGSYIVNLR